MTLDLCGQIHVFLLKTTMVTSEICSMEPKTWMARLVYNNYYYNSAFSQLLSLLPLILLFPAPCVLEWYNFKCSKAHNWQLIRKWYLGFHLKTSQWNNNNYYSPRWKWIYWWILGELGLTEEWLIFKSFVCHSLLGGKFTNYCLLYSGLKFGLVSVKKKSFKLWRIMRINFFADCDSSVCNSEVARNC